MLIQQNKDEGILPSAAFRTTWLSRGSIVRNFTPLFEKEDRKVAIGDRALVGSNDSNINQFANRLARQDRGKISMLRICDLQFIDNIGMYTRKKHINLIPAQAPH